MDLGLEGERAEKSTEFIEEEERRPKMKFTWTN